MFKRLLLILALLFPSYGFAANETAVRFGLTPGSDPRSLCVYDLTNDCIAFGDLNSTLHTASTETYSNISSVLDYIPVSMRSAVRNGTNTSDLSSYINTALATCKNLDFSGFTYIATGLTTSCAGQQLHMFGSVITPPPTGATTTVLLIAGPHVKLWGPSINGLNLANYGIIVANNLVEIISPDITNVGSSGSPNGAISSVNNVTGLRVIGGHIYNNNAIGVELSLNSYDVVTGVNIEGGTAEAITVDNSSFNNVISNNVLHNNCLTGCLGGIGSGDTSNYNVFEGNVIDAVASGGACIGVNGNQNVIKNNICLAVTGYGIVIQTNGSEHSSNNIVEGNQLLGAAGACSVQIQTGGIGNVIGFNETTTAICDSGTQSVYTSGVALLYTASATVSGYGALLELGGTSNYTLTFPTPAGLGTFVKTETVWANTGSTVTLVTPSGSFCGPGNGNTCTATMTVALGVSHEYVSDGANWVAVR